MSTYDKDPEAFNMARYIGEVKPDNTGLITTNKQVVMQLSWPIAQATSKHFENMLAEHLSEEE